MEAGTAPSRSFDHLRENSIGLPQVLFQSITHMAPGAAIAFSILFSVGFAGPALPLSVLLALIACTLVAVSIGQLARNDVLENPDQIFTPTVVDDIDEYPLPAATQPT
jgi:amino acid transporter